MVLCLVPTTAFAEGETEETTCMHLRNGLHGRSNERRVPCLRRRGRFGRKLREICRRRKRTGRYVQGRSGHTAADVQALIDALPEAETIADNAADVEVQLEAIDEAKVQLSDEDFVVLDFTRYDAAVALMALSGEPDTPSRPRLRMTTPIATAAAVSRRATTRAIPT